jgi:hypothetical protein
MLPTAFSKNKKEDMLSIEFGKSNVNTGARGCD